MGERLSKLLLLPTILGGCSKLYDPDRLADATDALPDVAIPADPDSPVIDSVAPSVLVEGTGVGGSRPALLVLTGKNFVPSNINVEIKVAGGSTRMIMVDKSKLEVETHGLRVMVPISLPVDEGLGKDQTVPLDVQVTQDGSAGPVSVMLTGKLALKGLPELKAPPMGGLVGEVGEYSQIAITSGTITTAMNQPRPVILRSRSSVEITPNISVSALGQAGGPGGGRGGDGGAGGLAPGPGMEGEGPAGGAPPGGAAGFLNEDVGIGAFATTGTVNRGSGGAGGDGTLLGAAGAAGGGGGGSIEITAAGDLTIASISAKGAGPVGGGNPGGGGSGGVVLLRAGGALTATGTIDLTGGGTGAGGGAGARGRARYDAGGTTTGDSLMGLFRGPSFVNLPLVTRSLKPELTIIGKPFTRFQYYFTDASGGNVQGPFSVTVGEGAATFTVEKGLNRGLNRICLLVEDAALDSDTRNCVDLVYFQ
jgi:hypothetical protein